MRRVLTAVSLVAGLALIGGCQAEPPSKPCACPKGTGCQCPLPGAPHASGGAAPSRTETAKHEDHVAERDDHRAHRQARAHRHLKNRGETEQREASKEARGESRGRSFSRSSGALPYGYHSQSHAYALREGQRYYEGYGSEKEHAYGMHRHFRMRRYTENPVYGPEYDENVPAYDGEAYGPESNGGQDYGPDHPRRPDYEGEPEESGNPPIGYAGSGQMSINSAASLDSWHGYGVDCPRLHDEE